jgi:methionyl-tRNA formyltransferase
MRIVFMGTPEFALPSLKKLLASDHDVLAVVTRPDRPKGRGLREAPPPVKILAEENGLAVFQPEKLREDSFVRGLSELKADLFVVVAFRILPREVYTMPPKGTIDLHPSLLPKYRGAAPINWAIIKGERQTGITVFFIGEKVDAGDTILQRAVPIDPNETAGELSQRLADIGAQVLLEAVDAIGLGQASGTVQSEEEPSPAPKLKREDGRIDWTKSASQLKDLIRGLNPWPGAYTTCGGQMLKIHRAVVVDQSPQGTRPGQVLRADPRKGILVSTGKAQLYLQEVQLEGRKRMSSAEFLRGFHLKEGDLFS